MDTDLRRIEQQDAQDARIAREISRRARLFCSECGSLEGMLSWDRESVLVLIEHPDVYPWPARLYRRPGDDHNLYSICPRCNALEAVSGDYVDVTLDRAIAWAKTHCLCPECSQWRTK